MIAGSFVCLCVCVGRGVEGGEEWCLSHPDSTKRIFSCDVTEEFYDA